MCIVVDIAGNRYLFCRHLEHLLEYLQNFKVSCFLEGKHRE